MMLKKRTMNTQRKTDKGETLGEKLTQLLSGSRELEQMAWCISGYLESGSDDTAFLMM